MHLTKDDSGRIPEPDRPEIEVTDEMIEAAFDYLGDFEVTKDMIAGVFRAMLSASSLVGSNVRVATALCARSDDALQCRSD